MKKVILLFLILTGVRTFSQTEFKETFKFEDNTVEYTIANCTNKYINRFYVVITNTASLTDTFKKDIEQCTIANRNIQFYYVSIPEQVISPEAKEKFFLEFISCIRGRRSLADSRLYIIADHDYTKLFLVTRKRNGGRYNYGYLNPIEQMQIVTDDAEICTFINTGK